MACLAAISDRMSPRQISRLDSTFYQPVYPDTQYSLNLSLGQDPSVLSWRASDGSRLVHSGSLTWSSARATSSEVVESATTPSWQVLTARDPDIDEMPSVTVDEAYWPNWPLLTAAVGRELWTVGLSSSMAAALCALTYVIGMQVPGRRALLRSVSVGPSSRQELRMADLGPRCRAWVSSPRGLRRGVAEVKVDFQGLGGSSVDARATAAILPAVQIRNLPEILASEGTLSGMSAVVTGGSRGFGRELSLELGRRGCRVQTTTRHPAPKDLHVDDRVSVNQVDCRDPHRVLGLLQKLESAQSPPDLLVLNATGPLRPMWLDEAHLERIASYVDSEMRLVSVPLGVFAGPLDERRGLCIYVSSTALNALGDGCSSSAPALQAEWPHYLAVKAAAEALVTVASAEFPNMTFWSRRFNAMATSLVTSSLSDRESPTWVAKRLADDIETWWQSKKED